MGKTAGVGAQDHAKAVLGDAVTVSTMGGGWTRPRGHRPNWIEVEREEAPRQSTGSVIRVVDAKDVPPPHGLARKMERKAVGLAEGEVLVRVAVDQL